MAFLLLESGGADNLLLEDADDLLLDDGLGGPGETTVASQVVLEAITGGQAPMAASQVVLETIIAKQAQIGASQIVLELIIETPKGFPALLLYG